MRYRVYYSDGTTHDGPNPPPRDVQAILEYDDEGQLIIRSGGDYYVLRDGVWIEVDIFGLFDFLMDSGIVLFGRTVSNSEYREVMRKAMEEREVFDD